MTHRAPLRKMPRARLSALARYRVRPLAEMSPAVAGRIDTVFTDIDDTITSDGLVPLAAFGALWRARERRIATVLVTGRPAGWCDHLARMWPVAAVVGENGALAFALQDGRMRRLFADRPADAERRLSRIREQVLAEVPRARVAADQPYRQYDLAIDFCEEVDPPLSDAEIDRVVEIFVEHGATAKVSSIHVNGWFGAFDKLTMCRRCSVELLGRPLDVDRATFAGDSPNDVPMFAHFPHACGVANVRRWTSRMAALPAYVSSASGGEGFAEIVDHLVRARAAATS